MNRAWLVFPLIVLVAGCNTVSTGEPRAATSSAASTGGQPATSSSAAPSRPREVPLDDVDPCTLLPQADYGKYHLDKAGERGADDRGAARCAWFGDVGYMAVTLVTYEGVSAQQGRLGELSPADPIDDFPAYTVTVPTDENACFVSVDVADGQNLRIQAGLYSLPAEATSSCDYAHQFATSLMSTLVR